MQKRFCFCLNRIQRSLILLGCICDGFVLESRRMRIITFWGRCTIFTLSSIIDFSIRRYFQSQGFYILLSQFYRSSNLVGLFDAPIYITMIVAPINILLNYLLGNINLVFVHSAYLFLLVWGPEKIRLGFIGAPIATSISFNLITFLYLIYGCFIAPQTAWQPFSSKAFTEIGLLFRLGVAGFIQNAAEVRNCYL